MDLASIIRLSHAINIACNHKEVHEGAIMWNIPIFIKKIAAAALQAHLSLEARHSHAGVKRSKLPSYVQIISQLLESHAREDILADENIEIVCFIKLTNMSLLLYADVLRIKPLRFPWVHSGYLLEGTFVKVFLSSIGKVCPHF